MASSWSFAASLPAAPKPIIDFPASPPQLDSRQFFRDAAATASDGSEALISWVSLISSAYSDFSCACSQVCRQPASRKAFSLTQLRLRASHRVPCGSALSYVTLPSWAALRVPLSPTPFARQGRTPLGPRARRSGRSVARTATATTSWVRSSAPLRTRTMRGVSCQGMLFLVYMYSITKRIVIQFCMVGTKVDLWCLF